MNKAKEKPVLVAFDIIRCASGWLRRHMPDRFGTAEPVLEPDGKYWRAPVILTYPGVVLGEVGELLIDGSTGEVINFTEIEQMKAIGKDLWEQNHDRVDTAFLQSRNG
jgi:hypothetical protein